MARLIAISIVPIAIQVIIVIHIMRTGRDRTWIYVVVFLPLVGSIAYGLVEILPELLSRRNVQKVGAKVALVVNPGGKIRELQARLDFSPTVENRMALAEAWEEAGEHQKAIDLYQGCLEGIYKDDRHIMGRLGRACRAAGDNTRALQWYGRVLAQHGSFHEERDSLFYAMALEAVGDYQKADAAYAKASTGYLGLEAQYTHAAFLRRIGKKAEADAIVSTMIRAFDQLPPYAKRAGRSWVNAARNEMIEPRRE